MVLSKLLLLLDNQALASGIALTMTFGGMAYANRYTRKCRELRDKEYDEYRERRDKEDDEWRFNFNYNQRLNKLNQIHKDFIHQIYSSPHREVSEATRNLLNVKNQDEKTIEIWSSICKKNMEIIRALMESYVEERKKTKIFADKLNNEFTHQLISEGDAITLGNRFSRFIKAVKPDDNSFKDDETFDSQSFNDLLNDCVGNSSGSRKAFVSKEKNTSK